MQENFESVQRGFRVLVAALSGYIGQELNRDYKDRWWERVLTVLSDQRDLPSVGSYAELTDSLDIANCIRIIDRLWGEVFRSRLHPSCRAWAKELMGVRNIVSHLGQQDLDQPMAERALDTMALLCAEIDSDSEAELRTLHREVRERGVSAPSVQIVYTGIAQPKSESVRGELETGSLLNLVGTDMVQPTALTRKVTYGGKTVIYPVYKVRLDALYFNDQNDRITTWISGYESEFGEGSLTGLSKETYNRIIENFIFDSNPESIQKTQKNISLVGQIEPGVTLADGRVVDGNRRFTCLRRLQRSSTEPVYFETVLMDVDIREDKKQIKLLELAVQHGEEKKVDYDLIDYAVGTYRDVVQTKLLTAEEYAASANESVADVNKRIEIAELITEFLAYVNLPGQFHAAREYQVYSLFQEMSAPLRQLDSDGQSQLKKISFHNTILNAIPDQRRFIRDIKSLIKSDTYSDYFEEQDVLGQTITEKLSVLEIRAKADLDKFAANNAELAQALQDSMEKALQQYRMRQLKARPIENVSKSVSLLLDIDRRLFVTMDPDEKETLKAELENLVNLAEDFIQSI